MSRISNRGLNQLGPPRYVMRFNGVSQKIVRYRKPWLHTSKSRERLAAYRERMAQLFDKVPLKSDEQRRIVRLVTLDKARRRKQPKTISLPSIVLPIIE